MLLFSIVLVVLIVLNSSACAPAAVSVAAVSVAAVPVAAVPVAAVPVAAVPVAAVPVSFFSLLQAVTSKIPKNIADANLNIFLYMIVFF